MGPLPQLYRYLIAGLIVVLCVGTGVWLAGRLDLPLGGMGVGLAAGGLLSFLLLHDFRHGLRDHSSRVDRRR